jgi:hypothetical protein
VSDRTPVERLKRAELTLENERLRTQKMREARDAARERASALTVSLQTARSRADRAEKEAKASEERNDRLRAVRAHYAQAALEGVSEIPPCVLKYVDAAKSEPVIAWVTVKHHWDVYTRIAGNATQAKRFVVYELEGLHLDAGQDNAIDVHIAAEDWPSPDEDRPR